jgi:hypothetical protein
VPRRRPAAGERFHQNAAAALVSRRPRRKIAPTRSPGPAGQTPGGPDTLLAMHYEAHQPVINDIEARILTMRDSL